MRGEHAAQRPFMMATAVRCSYRTSRHEGKHACSFGGQHSAQLLQHALHKGLVALEEALLDGGHVLGQGAGQPAVQALP